jgi:hypothetical protein
VTPHLLRRFDRPSLDASGSWLSSWLEPGFPVHEAVPSWNADTPPGTRLDVELQGRDGAGETPWYALARWSSTGPRTSVSGQDDGRCRVDVDVLHSSGGLDAVRVRVRAASPSNDQSRGSAVGVRLVTLLASGARAGGPGPGRIAEIGVKAEVSRPLGVAVEHPVPPLAQFPHRGHHPELDGGGGSWCSPASTAMLLAFWGAGPTPEETAWVGEPHPDARVDHAARGTFDTAYGGCGNWTFNTAYAAGFGLDAFVTRLPSLRDAEAYLMAGIPLALSISAGPGELDGFLAEGSTGHIVVLAGMTAGGDPIVCDPAAEANDEVRRVYDRAQLERAWLRGSGTVYVVRPEGVSLPPGGHSRSALG